MIPPGRLLDKEATPTALEAAWIKRHYTTDPLTAHRKKLMWSWIQAIMVVLATLYYLNALDVFGLPRRNEFSAIGNLALGALFNWLASWCSRRRRFYNIIESGELTPIVKRAIEPSKETPRDGTAELL